MPNFVTTLNLGVSLRLILMGTGPFAVPSFDALKQAGHEIVAVVTRPTVLGAAKKAPPPSPVRVWACEQSLPVFDPLSINDSETIQWLESLQSDLMVVCDYGQILSQQALLATKLGGINLHGSLLPRHRGAAPVQWSILSGDSQAGISIIHMTPTLDGGPVLHQLATEIQPSETSEELELRLSHIGIESTLASIRDLESKRSISECTQLGIIQDKLKMTKAPRLKKEDGQINPQYSARLLDRLVRGLQPWPGTFMNVLLPDGKSFRMIVSKARVLMLGTNVNVGTPGDLLLGTILQRLLSSIDSGPKDNAVLGLVTTDGILALETVQPAGKRSMDASEFARGYSRYEMLQIETAPGVHRILSQMQSS